MSGKPKSKILTGSANIGTSKVNSKSECITLTYTIKNIKKASQITKFENEIPELLEQDVTFDLTFKNHTSSESEIVLKVKTKECDGEGEAHEIKETLDNFIQKEGGQTTLDEVDS